MPRTNPKPLKIGVIDIEKCATLKRFMEKGHIVEPYDPTINPSIFDWDVIIGPRCWRIDPKLKLGDDSTEEESLERQLEMMEKGVRNIKYPKDKKDD